MSSFQNGQVNNAESSAQLFYQACQGDYTLILSSVTSHDVIQKL